ncbi:hypothetical protein Tco_1212556 [Tanacetum coccineum]
MDKAEDCYTRSTLDASANASLDKYRNRRYLIVKRRRLTTQITLPMLTYCNKHQQRSTLSTRWSLANADHLTFAAQGKLASGCVCEVTWMHKFNIDYSNTVAPRKNKELFVPLCRIGIRALGYRELAKMSNSDELRHTDNTTLVPPRLPDTLPQVYHKRRPTLGLLILSSVSPFSPTIRRTARISIPPIEPNLAERARISAINLDDYQLDPITPPPSPSSPFSMAA